MYFFLNFQHHLQLQLHSLVIDLYSTVGRNLFVGHLDEHGQLSSQTTVLACDSS